MVAAAEFGLRLTEETKLGKRKNGEFGQYFMKDLTVLLTVEPCFMCAMALIHSRVSRVIYMNPNHKDGALYSNQVQLGYLKNLNHNYLVYKFDD